MSKRKLDWYPEPRLLFGHGQALEDPKDGLSLFGPLDRQQTFGVRVGVIGRRKGIDRYRRWSESIRLPIIPPEDARGRFVYPGFEAIYGIDWSAEPVVAVEVPGSDFDTLKITDSHKRVYDTVSTYADRIARVEREDDRRVDVWFVVVPEEVHQLCRPQSRVSKKDGVTPDVVLSSKMAKRVRQGEPALFDVLNEAAVPHNYELDFHNQLKARLLQDRVAIQIIREKRFALTQGELTADRDITRFRAEIAWNVTNAAYYKAGARPWKVDGVRDGVCYVGLVFKQDERHHDPRIACCAAQMFLDSGDGVVFKGAVGPWYNPERGDYHLGRDEAAELIQKAVMAYEEEMGAPPQELFVHGRVRFGDDEWAGFNDGASGNTNVVGVSIQSERRNLRIYHRGSRPALRGLAYPNGRRSAYLWTRGFVPRQQTYPGREVPIPLSVKVCQGEADLSVVLKDVMALTKLNYNTTNFADGLPVTLRFADAVGEILTAAPLDKTPPLPFRHYI